MLKYFGLGRSVAPKWLISAEAHLYETREILGQSPCTGSVLPAIDPFEQRPPAALPVSFGEFVLTRDPLKLSNREGHPLALQRQPLICLDLLVRNAHRPVSREEIRQAIWGDNRFIDHEQGINFIIYRIRTTLGDRARSPQFIETVPQTGYRWIAPIQSQTARSQSAQSPTGKSQAGDKEGSSWWRRLRGKWSTP